MCFHFLQGNENGRLIGSLLYAVVDFIIQVCDFKKQNPIKAGERTEKGLVFSDLTRLTDILQRYGFQGHRPRNGRRCETEKYLAPNVKYRLPPRGRYDLVNLHLCNGLFGFWDAAN